MPDPATSRDPSPSTTLPPAASTSRSTAEEARLSYRREGDVLDFYSTWTPPALRGKGLAAEVVKAGFDFAREEGLSVRPTCPYVDTFLRRHPRYRRAPRRERHPRLKTPPRPLLLSFLFPHREW